MKIINIDINDNIILNSIEDLSTGTIKSLNSKLKFPTGNYQNILLNFNFISPIPEEDLKLIATFLIGNNSVDVTITNIKLNNKNYRYACYIPPEVFEEPCDVALGLYGFKLDNNENLVKRMSLIPIANKVVKGSYDPNSKESVVPSPTVFEVYFNKIDNAYDEFKKDLNEINNRVKYYRLNEGMTETELLKIIESDDYAKVIDFEKGTYNFTKRIHLKSNTILNLNGSTINAVSSFFGYSDDSIVTGYDGEHDIKIIGGTINGVFAFMHNVNVEFNNVEFPDTISGHAMQIAGCKNFIIKGCTFNGSKIGTGENTEQRELIQLEPCIRAGQPYLKDENSVAYDGSGNMNILIEDNIFNKGDGTTSENYVCIGHHGDGESNQYYNENIIIRNNKFDTSKYGSINILALNNFLIEGNIFNQDINTTGANHIKLKFYNKNGIIRNNVFINGKHAIVNGTVRQQDNINIYGNKITSLETGSTGLSLQGFSNCIVSNNMFNCEKQAIYIDDPNDTSSDNLNIINNSFIIDTTNAEAKGIYLYGGDGVTIANNNVSQLVSVPFLHINNGASNYKYANNFIIKPDSKYVDDITGVSLDCSKIYNSMFNLYSGEAVYSEISEQAPTYSFNQFNTLLLTLQKNNHAGFIKSVILKPWDRRARFDPRTHELEMMIGGELHYAKFVINSNNSFSFSSDGNISLRFIEGYNEMQY